MSNTQKRSWWRRLWSSPWTHLVAAIVVVALLQTFVVKLYQVPSSSMEPTLHTGDRILVSRVAYIGSHPAEGDVVVFTADETWDAGATPSPRNPLRVIAGWFGDTFGIGPTNTHTLVKRVIGAPGQVVACCDQAGRVTLDGVPLDEPYVHDDLPFVPGEVDCGTVPESARCFPGVSVPSGALFVLGDNRSGSSDSAAACRGQPPGSGSGCARFAAVDDVVGKVFVRVWPLGSLGPVAG